MIIPELYGIVSTMQLCVIGGAYTTCGGIFSLMTLIWSYKIDHVVPDKYNIIGAAISHTVACIFFMRQTGIF
jgi:small multidrug resistance family-3 protein